MKELEYNFARSETIVDSGCVVDIIVRNGLGNHLPCSSY